MSVHQTKDGRWFMIYRENKKQKRKYFGRGDEARAAARRANGRAPRINGKTEKKVTTELARRLRHKFNSRQVNTEVRVDSGFIDILTPEEVIEVKTIREWKSAIGQVLAYRAYYQDRRPRIHLFGFKRGNKRTINTIMESCQGLNVLVSLDEVY